MRCSYCMPQGFSDYEEPQDWLTYAEIERVVAAFARLGTSRFRITGGEPLLRRNLSSLVARLAAVPGAHDISLSTNATQLAKQAAALKTAGVSRLNVSLDSLCAERVFDITRRIALAQVLDGLVEAKRCGFAPIKINMVVMAGVNEDEIDDMAEFYSSGLDTEIRENLTGGKVEKYRTISTLRNTDTGKRSVLSER